MEVGSTVEGVRAEVRVDGAPVGHVLRVAIDERLSGPAIAWVELDDGGSDDDLRGLLGRSAEVELRRGDGGPAAAAARRFCGVIREVEQRAGAPGWRARVEPGFACLDEERLTRPFVRLSAVEILRRLLVDGLGALDARRVELRLPEPPRGFDGADRCDDGFVRRPLCVQYGETTYDFCRRLLAEEGLAFFYDHAGARERLVIADLRTPRRAGGDGAPEVVMAPPSGLRSHAEGVFGLSRALAPAPGRPVRRWLDLADPRVHAGEGGREPVDGAAPEPAPARGPARRDDAGADITGSGDVLGFVPGGAFSVTVAVAGPALPGAAQPFAPVDRERPDWLEGELLLARVRHVAVLPPREAGGGQAPARHGRYENTFACVPAARGFRPPLVPRPRALQDWGLVVSASDGSDGGPADPIDASPSGCVRVRFLYDRREQAAAHDRSCWVPVSQAWAGPSHGVQVLPRAGMLARIEYMFGDPDRPVVADCLPTGLNVPPAALPEGKSRLTIRSRSLHEQPGDERAWNEIALDDAAGAEEVWIRAGRDLRRRVLRNEHATVARDESRLVGGRQSLRVAGQRTKIVSGSERERIGGSRRAKVGEDDQRTVSSGERPEEGAGAAANEEGEPQKSDGGHDTSKVRGRADERVAGTRWVRIDGHERAELEGGRGRRVKGDATLAVTGELTASAGSQLRVEQSRSSLTLGGGDATVAASGELSLSNGGGELALVPGGEATLTLARLELRCGSAQVTLGDGKVVIKAPAVVARAALGKLRLDAQGAAIAGKDVRASAVLLNEVKGPMVTISDSPGNLEPLAAEKIHVQVPSGIATSFDLADTDATTTEDEGKP